MQKVTFILLMAVFLFVNSWADFDAAISSYERQDYISASSEFKKLANNNDSDAQYMLAYMYATGKGVVQDYIAAHKWFNLAASNGNNDAIKARDSIERRMNNEQIAQAQKQARAWQPGAHQTPVLNDADLQPAPEPEVEISDKESIRQVQSKLSQLGYRPGTADGVMGNNTRRAIRQYQYDNKLLEDAKITQSLITSLFPDGLPQDNIQVVQHEHDVFFPDIWTQENVTAETGDEQLRTQLMTLIERGRQRRAAQTWFLNELTALITPPQADWSVVLSDDFQDGDFSVSPEWSVVSGHFSVTKHGLHSQVNTRKKQSNQHERSKKDFSTAILGVILEHASRNEQQEQSPQNNLPEAAIIITEQVIANQFALQAKLTILSQEGQVEFGPFSGAQQEQGYQLFIYPEKNQIELLRISSRGSSVIESKEITIALHQAHVFEWLRDAAGIMTIAMDGEQLFQVSDRGYKKDFSGFMLQNLSGSMVLNELKIATKSN